MLDDAFQRDAVACSAPGEEQDVWLLGFWQGGNNFGGGMGAGFTKEGGIDGLDQFGDPVLGVDEWLAPLFAVDDRFCGGRCGEGASVVEGALDLG